MPFDPSRGNVNFQPPVNYGTPNNGGNKPSSGNKNLVLVAAVVGFVVVGFIVGTVAFMLANSSSNKNAAAQVETPVTVTEIELFK